jgi:hypothetical protein
VSLKKDTLAINVMRNLNTATPGEAKQIGSDTASSSTDEISKSLTQQGDKSAKSPLSSLLALLALCWIRGPESSVAEEEAAPVAISVSCVVLYLDSYKPLTRKWSALLC